jgi:MFS family permease
MISLPRSSFPSGDAEPVSSAEAALGQPAGSLYDGRFWAAFVANTLVNAGVALLYWYADFVRFLGGAEWHLGWIVGVGMIGSLTARLWLGAWIDRFGPRRVWLLSVTALAAVLVGHVAISSHASAPIFLLRIAYSSALAGVYSSSVTFISMRSPRPRLAEMVGMLGTSGFVGLVLGTQLGDLLFSGHRFAQMQVDAMFVAAGLLTVAGGLFSYAATRGQAAPVRRRIPPLLAIVRRYQPGTILLVGAAMGAGVAIPATFLRPYAAELGLPRIALFFTVYAPAAIITRIATRRMFERLGVPLMVLMGLTALAVSQALFLLVRAEWQLVIPGVVYGMAHAVLFPGIIAGGSSTFPDRYRGLGTTLMLAMFDIGQLVGAPIAGGIIHFGRLLGLPGYPAMFLTVGLSILAVAGFYAATARWHEPLAPRKRRKLPAPLIDRRSTGSSRSSAAAPHGSRSPAHSRAASGRR